MSISMSAASRYVGFEPGGVRHDLALVRRDDAVAARPVVRSDHHTAVLVADGVGIVDFIIVERVIRLLRLREHLLCARGGEVQAAVRVRLRGGGQPRNV